MFFPSPSLPLSFPSSPSCLFFSPFYSFIPLMTPPSYPFCTTSFLSYPLPPFPSVLLSLSY